jgi:hypothetical protein
MSTTEDIEMFEDKNDETVQKIKTVIGNYFQGYLKAEPETLSKAFHAASRLYCTDRGNLEKTEIAEWLTSLEERRKKGDIRSAKVEISGIDVSGDAAVARTKLVLEKVQFTDYLSLLQIEGQWKIINKIYTVEER